MKGAGGLFVIDTWSPAIVPALLLVAAIWVPGTLILLAARVRGLAVLAFAPLISLSLISVLPIVFQRISISWGWPSLSLVTLAISAVLIACRKWIPQTQPLSATMWPVIAGVIGALPFAARPMVLAINDPRMPPQTWDAVLHVNAVRRIVETGDGSSLTLGAVSTVSGTPRFYPGGFHDLVALGFQGDIVVAINTAAVVLACVVWPFCVAVLLASLKPQSYLLPICGAFAAISFTALPSRPASYGTLWPVMAAYVVIPLVLAALVRALRRNDGTGAVHIIMTLIAGGGIVALTIVHPSAFFVLAILNLPIIIGALIYHFVGSARLARPQYLLAWFWLIGTIGATFVAWNSAAISAMEAWRRQPFGEVGREVLGVIADSQLAEQGYGDPLVEWGLAVLTIVGVVMALGNLRMRWLVVDWLVACYFAVLAAVVTLPGYELLAPWYFDPVRLGAIVPIIAAPLVAIGFQTLVHWLGWLLEHLRVPGWLGQGVAVLILAALVYYQGTHRFGMGQRYDLLNINYHFRDENGLNAMISPAELEMQHRLQDRLPAGAKIIGDPRTGAALVYGVAGIETYFPHLDGDWGSEGLLIGGRFDTLTPNGEICTILRQEGVEYFYTDDLLYWPDNPVAAKYEGLVKVRDQLDRFTLIDSGGGAAVYHIDPCFSE